MKLLSHLMKLLHLMTLPSQQFYLCGTLFNVHDTLMKHALKLTIYIYIHVAHVHLYVTDIRSTPMRNKWRFVLGHC